MGAAHRWYMLPFQGERSKMLINFHESHNQSSGCLILTCKGCSTSLPQPVLDVPLFPPFLCGPLCPNRQKAGDNRQKSTAKSVQPVTCNGCILVLRPTQLQLILAAFFQRQFRRCCIADADHQSFILPAGRNLT